MAHHEKRRGDSSSEKFLGASCRWGVTLKQQDEQWRVLSFRTGHTHALEQLPERACLLMGQKTMRAGIPEKFMPIGQAMQRARIEASRIYTALTINAQIRDYANNMDLCRRSPRFQPQTCVIFDSMHNKNCFGLCLFCFSCMTPNGCTKVCCLPIFFRTCTLCFGANQCILMYFDVLRSTLMYCEVLHSTSSTSKYFKVLQSTSKYFKVLQSTSKCLIEVL